MDKIVSMCAYRDYVLAITEKGIIYKIIDDNRGGLIFKIIDVINLNG
jgi:hypothetical protein